VIDAYDGDDSEIELSPSHDECDGELVPYAERFPEANAKANAGIYWCDDCEQSYVVDKTPARTQ
jgi:hypothetical protein